MLDNIVVGVNAETAGRDALALTRLLAPDAHIILVNAYPADETLSRHAAWGPFGASLRSRAQALVDGVRASSGLDDAETRVVGATSAARAVQGIAADSGADLIVVGASRRTPLGEIMLGDVARSTLNGAPCPVAVAPRDYQARPLSRIGVAYDGSPEAQAALSFGSELAIARDGRLQVLQVIEGVHALAGVSGSELDATSASESLRLEAQVALDGALFELPVDADAEVVIGAADDHLRELARFSDVIVTGSRRFGQMRRVVLGSTTDRLMHGARCPVLVVPRGCVPTSGCPDEDAQEMESSS